MIELLSLLLFFLDRKQKNRGQRRCFGEEKKSDVRRRFNEWRKSFETQNGSSEKEKKKNRQNSFSTFLHFAFDHVTVFFFVGRYGSSMCNGHCAPIIIYQPAVILIHAEELFVTKIQK